jgi:hypothetical protein
MRHEDSQAVENSFGLGAWEVTARYGQLDFDTRVFSADLAERSEPPASLCTRSATASVVAWPGHLLGNRTPCRFTGKPRRRRTNAS